MKGQVLKKQPRRWVEMVDGRRFFSDDGWQTVWEARRGTHHRLILDKVEADRVRFLVAMGAAG